MTFKEKYMNSNKHISFFLKRIWGANKVATIVNFAQYILLGASSSLSLLFTANIINAISLYEGVNPNSIKINIVVNAFFLALIALFQLFFEKFSQALREKHIYAVRQNIEKEICVKLSRIPQDILDTKEFQDDFRIVNETNTNLYLFITYIAQGMSLIVQLAMPLILVTRLSWPLLFPSLCMVLFSVYRLSKIQLRYWSEYLSNTTLRRKMDYHVGLFMNEGFFSVIRAFSREDYFFKKAKSSIDESINNANEAIANQNKKYAKLQLVILIIPIAIALVAVRKFYESHISVGDVIMFLGLGKSIHSAVISSGVIVQKTQEVSISLKRVYDFIFDSVEVNEDDNCYQMVECVENIEIDNLTFYYPKSKIPALSNISLSINSGDLVAFVGENGSGKTTLIKILLGLYKNYEGSIRINGINLRNISQDNLMKIFAPCFQDYLKPQFLLKEAVGLSRIDEMDDVQIKEVLQMNNGTDMIEAYSLDTQLGTQFTNGVDLSIGQWQKVAVSRAMYAERNVILADEPMASLDIYSELQLLKAVKLNHNKNAPKISILISHRMAGIKMCSKIFVLDCGVLVEEGEHEHLISLGGKYSTMYNAQNDSVKKGNGK
jgi:ABC-type multidrug transport system fused ATPase/permease subunit